ncbi:MAG: gliding motility-associated C-terminal domain-containing protein [Flavobacteriales bacterium]|nr:gliding motility-associated C-terminal domain-containing protein [Flavobacteriales bacterium]
MRTPQFIATLVVCIASDVSATHIIGGEMIYDHAGGTDHLITLRLYRDCGPGNTNGTGFDPTAELAVYDGNGLYLFSEFMAFPGATNVPVVLNNPCLTAPPGICVEVAEYTALISLPANASGYVLSYQRCCRTPAILNLVAPNQDGLTCTVRIPPSGLGPNSSPRFNAYPALALCLGQAMVFDHSAVDPDGDQLVYELCTPFAGGTNVAPAPSPPAGPPFPTVNWAAGYSQSYQMDANPALTVDAVTGELTVTPTLVGSFVVGVLVKEYRNGTLLGEVRRDFRFDVVPCIVNIVSAIQQQQVFCDGYDVQMSNLSSGGTSYSWDFGELGLTSDTSTLFEPAHTYSDTGSFEVMLIVNPGWPCADTSYSLFEIYAPLEPAFLPPPIQCVNGAPVLLEALGNFTSAADINWDFGGAGTPAFAVGAMPEVQWGQAGTHAVGLTISEHGCTEQFMDSVLIFPRPVPFFSTDTAGCTPLRVTFDNGSFAWTPMVFDWSFGEGSTSDLPVPDHMYPEPGAYDVSLTVRTDSGCIDTVTLLRTAAVTAWDPPRAGAFPSETIISMFDPTVQVLDASSGASYWHYEVEGVEYNTPSFNHTFQDAGYYTVQQEVTSGLGCADTTSFVVHVADHLFHAPNAFTPNGDGANDIFLPVVLGARLYALSIFDRWGQLIYSTDDPNQGWDGAGAPDGLYLYKAWLAEYSAVRKEFVGMVTLLR